MKVQVFERIGAELVPLEGLASKDVEVINSSLLTTPYVFDAFVDNDRVCLIGLIPPSLMSDRAYIWMHTTPIAEQHKFIVIRYSQRILEKILAQWPVLYGHCIVSDTRAIRWMKWLGAVFGNLDKSKLPFVIRRK